MIGLIYEITNADRSIVYIGSTTQSIEKRWNGHKGAYRKWINGKSSCNAAIHHHFKQYGIDKFDIEAIEQHEVDSIDQLLEFEQLVIDKTENTCNKQKAFNPIRLTEKQRYEARRDTLNAKTDCGCGGRYSNKNKCVHARTKRHIDWLNTQ